MCRDQLRPLLRPPAAGGDRALVSRKRTDQVGSLGLLNVWDRYIRPRSFEQSNVGPRGQRDGTCRCRVASKILSVRFAKATVIMIYPRIVARSLGSFPPLESPSAQSASSAEGEMKGAPQGKLLSSWLSMDLASLVGSPSRHCSVERG